AFNRRAIARIKECRAVSTAAIDQRRRDDYERDMLTTLPGVSLPRATFEKVRADAIAALADRDRSPCAYFSGDQAAAQGIPKEEIPHDVRCYTTDVEAAIPEVPELFSDEVVHAIRSCIGSNFRLTDVTLTRNYHVPPALSAKYDLL